ncbi:unnamed protein product [Orchesella dallaii]|uniref:Protein kinase domain-containing protein n=1 Tax=Orchesella dallaii TaxID=48710 RepID=A0ABP1R4T1_9HEXA
MYLPQTFILIFFLTATVLQVYGTDVGVAFAPMVRQGDLPNTRSYTKEMVKTMLKIILKADYHSVTTWGVGAPNKPWDKNAITEASSIVHTSIAAAEINKEQNHLALTIYQGLYQSVYEDQVNSEIEIGIQIAKEANEIFPGTVPALLFPSRVGFNELIDNVNLNSKLKNVSERVRKLSLKFGVRITDCPQIPSRSRQKVKDVVSLMDFIICMMAPDENKFKFGFENFKNSAILSLLQVEDFLEKEVKINTSSNKLILETGWAGDEALKPPNSVGDLKGFWKLITTWAMENNRQVFLHEAFDSPWKDTISEGTELAAHYGRWKYNESEEDLLSKYAYKLKEDPIPSPIAAFFVGFSWTQGGILVGVVLLIAIITLMTLLYKRVNRIEFTVISENDVKAFFDGAMADDGEYVDAIWEKSPYDKSLELAKSQLKIDTTGKGLLGSGQFGFVYRGNMHNSDKDVAVKMTRPYSPPIAVKCLLSEIKILMYVGSHNHVCKLLGACTEEISNGIVYFAMELCQFGSLEKYLQKNKSSFESNSYNRIENPNDKPISDSEQKPLTESQLIRWSYEIASAMAYISSKRVIHADLAARNVLLAAELTTKVTDFGLSRRLLEENPYYSKSGTEPLPWKWMAPESLEQRKFSTKSDVWSYGVTLWEIFSLGASPHYPNIHSWTDLLPYLKTGARLKMPEYATLKMYEIMQQSWILEYGDRPSFDEILEFLIAMIDMDYRDL